MRRPWVHRLADTYKMTWIWRWKYVLDDLIDIKPSYHHGLTTVQHMLLFSDSRLLSFICCHTSHFNRQLPLGQWPIDQQILIIDHISDQSFPQQVMSGQGAKGSEQWRPEQVFDYRLWLRALYFFLITRLFFSCWSPHPVKSAVKRAQVS